MSGLGDMLRHERRKHQLSLRAVGAVAGCSFVTVGELERGECTVGPVLLRRICDAVGTNWECVEVVAVAEVRKRAADSAEARWREGES